MVRVNKRQRNLCAESSEAGKERRIKRTEMALNNVSFGEIAKLDSHFHVFGLNA